MNQKKKKSQDTITHTTNATDILTETVRISQLSVSNEFEIKKLSRPQEGFLHCSIEEKAESLIIHYDIHNLCAWNGIRKEKRELMYAALMDAGRLQKAAELYRFSLNPENLYYDIQGRVYVKARDVYGEDGEYSPDTFIQEYKSLIGCTLVKKYRFENYNLGGQDLLKEDKFLSTIFECVNVEEILDRLYKEYLRDRKEHQEQFTEISKSKNRGMRIGFVIALVLLIIGTVLIGYLLIWERPYMEAVIAANEAYLQSDYNGTVEAMQDVEVDRMNVYQKYILSYSCVRCESFSDDNMHNILNTITLNGDEKVMEYWIAINRLDTEGAIDIAMQLSSDQLLLYAYLKEKAVIENDASLSGQEKNERLSDIESKLKPLEEELSALIGE